MKTSASRWSQAWLPSVTASAPASKRSSQIASVIPKPPAAFSPLTTTASSRQRSRKAGRRSATTVRPGRPTTSPRKRRRMSGFCPRTDHLRLRHHNVEPPIVILRRHTLDLLRGEREADRQDRVHVGERRDGTVEMALAVTDAAALPVEGGERDEKGFGEALGRVGARLAHPEPAFHQHV